jgi:hypothetical protein
MFAPPTAIYNHGPGLNISKHIKYKIMEHDNWCFSIENQQFE